MIPRLSALVLAFVAGIAAQTAAEDAATVEKLKGLDAYMEKVVEDWNVPGIGVAVVTRDELVFAKGYGFRDYGRKLPFTPKTTVPIASNTKLFTAVAVGFLVEEGKLEWDRPVREFVPAIEFFDDELDRSVNMRDMLGHRTGVTRHDSIWYRSEFSRKELFERLKYLEPSQPIRQTFLYNNLMYAGAGYVIELLSGKTWEVVVQERILDPLSMSRTVFSPTADASSPRTAATSMASIPRSRSRRTTESA